MWKLKFKSLTKSNTAALLENCQKSPYLGRNWAFTTRLLFLCSYSLSTIIKNMNCHFTILLVSFICFVYLFCFFAFYLFLVSFPFHSILLTIKYLFLLLNPLLLLILWICRICIGLKIVKEKLIPFDKINCVYENNWLLFAQVLIASTFPTCHGD